MIAKNKKGKSFGGCVRYVLNEGHEILESEGVLAEDAASITRDFAIQRSGRPEIKRPVGHIAVAFSQEDSWKMSNVFMLKLAHEYMEEMGICNTQYVIVRHHNTDHEHFHIVYNRIDNDLKLISVNNDYKRNIKVCKKLKDKYNLTYGKGKEKVNRSKLMGADKVKYQIHDEITVNLPKCISYENLENRLRQAGISIQYKYRSGTIESPENIQGVSFRKENYSFKGSEIDRKFSHANLSKVMSVNLNEAWDKVKDLIIPEVAKRSEPSAEPDVKQRSVKPTAPKPEQKPAEPPQQTPKPAPPVKRNPVIGGIEITKEQWVTLQSGGHIYLENMNKKDGNGRLSAYVFTDDEKKMAYFSNENPDKMVGYGGVTIRQRDKILVENGSVVKAKMKWWGGIDYQYPFVWKDSSTGEIKHSFADPCIPKEIHEKEMKEFDKRIRQNIPPPKKGPKIGR